ncbi:MAG TPA: DUF3592 domain-containing protein [Gemmatimonadales bacterium]|nr:DUF3592 domain-containing protein [Gemmatimonadales bacterium]
MTEPGPHPEVGVTLGLLAFGGTLTVSTGIKIWRGLRSQRWERVPGHITSSQVLSDLPGSSTRYTTKGPMVRYGYRVGGQIFEGSRISFARSVAVGGTPFEPIFGQAPDLLAGLRTGDECEVWYDPADPSRAVLRPGVSAGFWLLFIGGLAPFLLGLLLLPVAYFAFFE